MNHLAPNLRLPPFVLGILVGACFAVSIVFWLKATKHAMPATNPDAAVQEGVTGEVAVTPAGGSQDGTPVGGPATTPALSVDSGQPASGALTESGEAPAARGVPPVSIEEETKVYETAARALSKLANPETNDQTLPTGTGYSQSNPGAPVAQPITNGVQAYRETDRLRRQRVQEMRALRNATIAEARRNQTNSP